jgi:auxin efflux carrier family protein
MFIVGAELALVPNSNPGVVPTAYSLFVRFIVMPGVSLLFVYLTAGRGWYTNDKLVWYVALHLICVCLVWSS